MYYHAEDIGSEIGKQTKLVNKLNAEMDKTQQKMDFVSTKLSKMLKTNDMGTLYTIMCLSFILFILIILVIVT